MKLANKLALVASAMVSLSVSLPRSARAEQVELRVLLVTVGSRTVDPAGAMMMDLMDNIGVPYQVLDSSVQDLTDDVLVSNGVGRFNGIILTDSQTYVGPGVVGFDTTEFQRLQAYESRFGVAESVMGGWPLSGDGVIPDYGMIPSSITGAGNIEGAWTGPAGGTEMFEYVRVDRTLPTTEWAFPAIGRPQSGASPVVEPVLVDSAAPSYVLLAELTYPTTGRHVLLSTLNNPWWAIHAQVLAYEFLNFATSGVFIGGRYVYLSPHVDDLFLESEVWDPATNTNFSEDVLTYRLNGAAINNYLQHEKAFRTKHPLVSGFRVEWAFNGIGADTSRNSSDSLTNAIRRNKGSLRFINHTYSHLDMTRPCLDTEVDPTVDCGPPTDYASAWDDISSNRDVWAALGLPERTPDYPVLVSGGHSGLSDLPLVPGGPAQPFPLGANPNFLDAATDLGVRTFAADTSRVNQNKIQRIPGYDAIILPRYPTAIFYNATNPTEDTDEYNYIHYERYLAMGQDPCTIPGAICSPRTYEQILAAEADTTLRELLSYRPFPHYFHQSNHNPYASGGATLQFDWLESIMAQYERYMNLPVRSLLYRQLGDEAWRQVLSSEAAPSAVLDTAANIVTLTANASATVRLTGIANGTIYGGQRIGDVAASTTPVSFTVDRGYLF